MTSEQEDNTRLRKADEFLAYCRATETEARRALAGAAGDTARAKARLEELFFECEARAVERALAPGR